MIQYGSGAFGLRILFRIHGSAVYKSFFPCLLTSIIFVILFEYFDLQNDSNELFLHPYPMGALISALTFLLAFRANFSYNRYWESVTAVHQMHSKWLDVGMTITSFHLQSSIYNQRKPPAFGTYPQINCLERARERKFEQSLEELGDQLDELADEIAEADMTRSQPPPLIIQKLQKSHRKIKSNQLPMIHEYLPSAGSTSSPTNLPRPNLVNRTRSVQLRGSVDIMNHNSLTVNTNASYAPNNNITDRNEIPRPKIVTKAKTIQVPRSSYDTTQYDTVQYDPFQNYDFPRPEPFVDVTRNLFYSRNEIDENVIGNPKNNDITEVQEPSPVAPNCCDTSLFDQIQQSHESDEGNQLSQPNATISVQQPQPHQVQDNEEQVKSTNTSTTTSRELGKQNSFRRRSVTFKQIFKSRSNTNLSNSVEPVQTTTAPPSTTTIKSPKLGDMQAATGSFIPAWDHDKPPLFLQEVAHLLSLLSAVAFSTLRNDLEQADSPLITFVPNAPWPHVDPDAYTADVRKDWENSEHRSIQVMRYISGWSRTKKARTLYNAARPFRVIGGVSDAEIELLQAARGPLAKVALVSMWLQEFIVRETLAGSTGNVPPPILSRLFQYVSDGMLGYHQAHKVAYIPFPFPHAQITSLFVLIVVALMPVLMLSYLTNAPFGFMLNLFTVMSFVGLHEVAREMESPFQNVPNDIPLNNFQAQYNEALMTIFTGYHPDAFWEVVHKEKDEQENAPTSDDASVHVEQ